VRKITQFTRVLMMLVGLTCLDYLIGEVSNRGMEGRWFTYMRVTRIVDFGADMPGAATMPAGASLADEIDWADVFPSDGDGLGAPLDNPGCRNGLFFMSFPKFCTLHRFDEIKLSRYRAPVEGWLGVRLFTDRFGGRHYETME